jgi:transcriptional regulator with XRE-family HTH domain
MGIIDYFTTNDDISRLLASRIKEERIAQKLKQEELAKKANVKIHVVRNLEQHSKVTLDNLISILRGLKKLSIFEDMFDFSKERIEVDAFKYKEDLKKRSKKRVYDEKQ